MPEIFGITDSTQETIDADYKALQRLDRVLRGNSDYNMTQGILAENKHKYIKLMRDVINHSDMKKIIMKLDKGKELTEKEHICYMEFMMEHEEDEQTKEKVALALEIEKKVKKIRNEVNHILHVLCNYFDTDSGDLTKIAVEEYEKGIEMLSKEIEKKCKELDIIEDLRYEEKLYKAVSVYGEKHINTKNI